MSTETISRLLNVRDAAKFLGIGVQTLYQKRTDIPRIRIGRRILFDRQDLEGYIDSHRVVRQGNGNPETVTPSTISDSKTTFCVNALISGEPLSAGSDGPCTMEAS